MTILWAAGEPADFPGLTDLEVNAFTVITSSGYYEGGVARSAWYKLSAGPIYSPLESPVSELWLHFDLYKRVDNVGSYHAGNDISIHDASNNLIFNFRSDGVSYSARSPFHANSATFVIPTFSTFDAQLIQDPVNGVIRWWNNGVLLFEFLGDTRGAFGDAAKIGFGQTAGAGTVRAGHYSQIIVSAQPTIGAKLYTRQPIAIGADAQWTGAVTDVNHIGVADVSSVNTDTVGNRQSFTISPPASLPTGLEIAAIRQTFRAARDPASAINNLQPYLKVGGTNYNSGAAYALPTVTGADSRLVAINPATGLPWQLADLTGLETGFEATA